MTSERCAFLSLVAIAHKLEEAWICFFPVLPLMYISQYLPTIGKRYVQTRKYTITLCVVLCQSKLSIQFSQKTP